MGIDAHLRVPCVAVPDSGYLPRMTEPHVTLDPASLDPASRRLQEPLEQQLTSALQDAAAEVRAGYAGESVEEVMRHLVDRARQALHPDIAAAFQPDAQQLRRLAEEITVGR